MSDSKAFYVYGVVAQNGGLSPEVLSLAPCLRLWNYKEITALVGEVPLGQFGQAALAENLKDLQWVKDNVQLHGQVLQEVAKTHTVIPMKFGAIFTSRQGLEDALNQSYSQLRQMLERFKDHEEWGVKVYGDGQIQKLRIARASARAQELLKDVSQKASGTAYLLQKKVQGILEEEVDLWKARVLMRVFCRLSSTADEGKLGNLTSCALGDRKKPMIFNGIFLIARRDVTKFQRTVTQIRKKMSYLGWTFEPVGPFPPYHFSDTSGLQEVQQ